MKKYIIVPIVINTIYIIKTINELFLFSKDIVEVVIIVKINVNINAPPFKIPITWAYPIGKHNSHPKS